jgi:ribosomal protein L11 methyltransferase
VANLVAGVLVEIAGELADEVAPRGRLIVSGIFEDREQDVIAAFDSLGLHVRDRRDEAEWLALELRRPG